MTTKPKRTDLGKITNCKFCRRACWWDKAANAMFELIGDELHSDHCERRKAFYKQRAADIAQARRGTR